MNCNCENCGWSEIIGSPIMCNYNGHRTWRDECCEAWKPKEKETNLVEVVRCKDCKYKYEEFDGEWQCARMTGFFRVMPDWFCAYGEV